MGSRAYDLVWGTTLRATTRLHRILHTVSRGKLGRRFPGGAQVVWITTLGRKSGEWRRTPLLGVPIDGGWGIAGSNAGQEKVPGWVYNVMEHDRGQIDIGGVKHDAVFNQVFGELRDRIYNALISQWSAYDMYQRNISREIPVYWVQIERGTA